MFKELGLKYRTKRASKKRVDLINQSEKKTKKVGIITSKEIYKTTGFKSFINKLIDKGMDTDILVFNSDMKHSELSSLQYTIKDYSWSGKIKSPLVNKFIKTPFDFLFSVNTSSILHIENILALSNAKCRIGTTTDQDNEHLDFMIKVKENSSIDKLTNSMLHYTEIQY
jgi:hypothetical protein